MKKIIVNKTEEWRNISEFFYRLDEKIYCFVLEEWVDRLFISEILEESIPF